ncbi:MAG TPA: nickel pincer cofactor biosynthesis protein LarB [Polyangiaceae bacterium LLY-WYZ-14_1]|nr:nickel pincer cofactor biosynthesis protein LarB [Polyangiaceae bacterium LLY-WYZ-14_1]
MDPNAIRALLEAVRAGSRPVDDALAELRELPFRDLGFARVDHHRALRTGFPEIVFGAGKTPEQLVALFREISDRGQTAFATRVTPEGAAALAEAFGDTVDLDPVARTAVAQRGGTPTPIGRAPIAVVAAGTSDLPVAEEAAVTATVLGSAVRRIYDVGVAGLHRLLPEQPTLEASSVVIVCAGMEGALPSVVAGLVSSPVIAVPTSIGYGASLGGLAALLANLSACAPGVTVVNVDNGFGAAYAACLVQRRVDGAPG